MGAKSLARYKLPEEVSSIKQLRVACILDDFSFRSFNPECNLLQLDPTKWLDQIESFRPHLLFVESAWKGLEGKWEKKISNTGKEIIDLVVQCSSKKIPTVFWAKEDPVHFSTFLSTAKMFDFIFTTDSDCLSKYKSVARRDSVFLLPFGVQPLHFNPIVKSRRKDSISFAGSYYRRYPERMGDFERMFTELIKIKNLEIFDRYHNSGLPEYEFPKVYESHIRGRLPIDDIDQAYKGYVYGMNLNTVKQSQSMFSRRVFELLASGTLVISNYSRGMRIFFGDLAISTDNPEELIKKFKKLEAEPDYRDKIRISSVRTILANHTIKNRIQRICKVVFGSDFSEDLPQVSVVSIARAHSDFKKIIINYERQKYPNKRLFIISDLSHKVDGSHRVTVLPSTLGEGDVSEIVEGRYLAFFHPDDHYGHNYLSDMANALTYQNNPFITRSARYSRMDVGYQLNDSDLEFREVDDGHWRCSLVPMKTFSGIPCNSVVESLMSGTIHHRAFGIDRFNYCEGGSSDSIETIDDISDIDFGMEIDKIYQATESDPIKDEEWDEILLNGNNLFQLLRNSISKGIDIVLQNESSCINISVMNKNSVSLIFNNKINIKHLVGKQVIKLMLDAEPTPNISMKAIFIAQDGAHLQDIVVKAGQVIELAVTDRCSFLQLAFICNGPYPVKVRGVRIGEIDKPRDIFISKGEFLIVTNNYPSYGDVYRNSFIHSRVKAYKKRKLPIDVLKIAPRFQKGFQEFEGIDVISSNDFKELHTIIQSKNYKKILIHFLDRDIWEVVKNYINEKKTIVWVHGSEIQPYHRRDYNYDKDGQRRRAIERSKDRIFLWREIIQLRHPNIHFVFVSRYFFDEVTQDLDIQLYDWQYSIIHNFVDVDEFRHEMKRPEDRLRILSVRSFASRKYANDVTVQAIKELSSRPFFSELHIKIIGDGELFDSVVEPLTGYSNVELVKGFLSTNEYVSIFREYGILLIPTRWDSQGVTRDEAMSSGMVIVSNPVAAVPEFVDSLSGVLVEPENGKAIADAVERLYYDPDLFMRLSAGAAERVRRQNGFINTIEKEISLIVK